MRQIETGDVIKFTPRYQNIPLLAVVVRKQIWLHCLGASSVTVYAPESPGLYQLDLGSFETVTQPEPAERELNLTRARLHYAAHLAQYPRWQARLERGEGIGW